MNPWLLVIPGVVLLIALLIHWAAESFLEDSKFFKISVIGFLIVFILAAAAMKWLLPAPNSFGEFSAAPPDTTLITDGP